MKKSTISFAFLLLILVSCNQPNLTLQLSSEKTFTNGKLSLSVAVAGGDVGQVELTKNGEVFETLSTPFSYSWDTAKEAEGKYTFQARAKGFVSKKLMLTVDRTVPSFKQSFPLESNTNIRYADPISITFSEAIDAATVNSSSVSLSSGTQSLETTITLSSDGRTLTITPKPNTLTFPATINLQIKGLKDLASNVLADKLWTWELPYWVNWEESLNVDKTKNAVGKIVFDSKGNPVVFFAESEVNVTSPIQLYVKRWTGSDWQLIGGRVNTEQGYAHTIQIILDSIGNPIIAYLEYKSVADVLNGETPQVFIKHWTGNAWELITNFEDKSYGYIGIYLKPDGKHIIDDIEANTMYVKQWAGDHWEIIKAVPTKFLQKTSGLTVSIDQYNNPVVAWYEYDPILGFDYKLYVERWTGDHWEMFGSEAINFDDTKILLQFNLAIDPQNNPIMIWDEIGQLEPPYNQMLYVKRWTGNSWETFQEDSLNIDKTRNARTSKIGFDRQGNPVLNWYEMGEPGRSYAKAWIDGKWQLFGGESLNINAENDAQGTVYFDNSSKPYVLISELFNGSYQLFIREANQ